MRAGELHQARPRPKRPAKRSQPAKDGTWGTGSVTGGTTPPNGEQVELMYFEHTGVNPFVATEDDALSTFAVDVDNASWTLARNYLSRGELPPKDAIRVEEFVNAFDPAGRRTPTRPSDLTPTARASRFGDGYHLLRIGVVGKTVDDDEAQAGQPGLRHRHLRFMNRENRLGAVKQALHILLDELGEGDRVGIVVYGSRGEVRLEPTDISRREDICSAIDGLQPAAAPTPTRAWNWPTTWPASTTKPAKINRLILCSDGVANNGASTEAEEILALVRRPRTRASPCRPSASAWATTTTS